MSSLGALVACSGDSNDFDEPDDERGGTGGSSRGGRSGSGGADTGGSSGTGQGGSSAQGGGSGTGQGGMAGTPGGTGGAGRGGSAGSQGGSSGDEQGGSAGDEQGGSGGFAGECMGQSGEARRHGQRGRSSGFSGTDDQYFELYDVPCASVDDCIDPCTTRGGTELMCEASICVDSTSDYCLPPTVWRNMAALRSEGTGIEDGAVLTLVFDPYEDFLLVDDFKHEIPEAAEIMGITVTIRRAGGSSMEASDGAVRLIKRGAVGASDRSLPTNWTGPEYVNVDYGGPTDLWGETWTPADVNSLDFGVALSALYTDSAGNGRAYVDIVYTTIHYRTTCE